MCLKAPRYSNPPYLYYYSSHPSKNKQTKANKQKIEGALKNLRSIKGKILKWFLLTYDSMSPCLEKRSEAFKYPPPKPTTSFKYVIHFVSFNK